MEGARFRRFDERMLILLPFHHVSFGSARQLEKLATEFSGDGDFTICPGYTGSYGSASDKWGRLYIPGANASYRVARSRLATWRAKTQSDERFAWWPEAMQRRGVDPVKVSYASGHIAPSTLTPRRLRPSFAGKRHHQRSPYRHLEEISHRLSQSLEGRIPEAVLEQADDPTPAAGVLLALADGASSSTGDKPGGSS